ncbi:hypothetical protein LVB77_18960 [Lysobacter sp. 5GHs7-4]|uniref:hypothetical protein n=1 Tax=Lysobacter sp. 5GHs7-4 TaxID=2904253 RepID=UPI001E5B3855|nr:hypothetical protein [Lysobacter sp. 5GHs7-4]UHQ22703.1 hypothetical protein LVB77_18960 [Lysobacter sp. 5GHs7-4]
MSLEDALRYRSMLVEHLELLSSAHAQREYQRTVPIASVSAELFCIWYDHVADEAAIARFVPPAFSPDEQTAVRRMHAVLEGETSRGDQSLPCLEDFIDTPSWRRLHDEAVVALAVFQQRGAAPADLA